MTIVTADIEGDTFVLRSDSLVTVYNTDGTVRQRSPLPKLVVPHPHIAMGVAGDDPNGAVSNIITMAKETNDAEKLREFILEDGAHNREYLMGTADRRLFVYKAGGWTEIRYGRACIGDPEKCRQYQGPVFTHGPINPVTDKDLREGLPRDFLDNRDAGTANDQLSREMQWSKLTLGSREVVGGIMLEVHLLNGKFEFWQQTKRQIFGGGPAIQTVKEAAAAMAGSSGMDFVEYELTQDPQAHYPAHPLIRFTRTGAALRWHPTCDGYQHEFIQPQ